MDAPDFDPYRAPQAEPEARRDPRHSRIGIASLVAFGVSAFGILLFVASIGATAAFADDPADVPPVAIVLATFGFMGSMLSSGVGAVLGLVGSLQRQRNRLTGVLGLSLNGAIAFGYFALFAGAVLTAFAD